MCDTQSQPLAFINPPEPPMIPAEISTPIGDEPLDTPNMAGVTENSGTSTTSDTQPRSSDQHVKSSVFINSNVSSNNQDSVRKSLRQRKAPKWHNDFVTK